MSIRRHLSCAAGLLLVGLAPSIGSVRAQEAARPVFREGTCSGVLCDYIGGSQAPAAQQTSLFREGQCGGVLCDAIGGPQAPKRTDPPPSCGGGLLCDLMPYRMGAALTPAGVAQRQDAVQQQASLVPAAPATSAEKSRHRRRKDIRAVRKDAD